MKSHLNRLNIRRKPLWVAIATAMSLGFGTNPAHAQVPTGASVVAGSASIATVGNNMTVTNSPNAILNWNSFSIGASNAVSFAQQSAASAVLNRVVGQDPSAILGQLYSNGRVFLINPNGILFGQGARIDVAGLVASTLNLSNTDFLNGAMRFGGDGITGGSLLNQGDITTPMGGQVYLIGNSVSNEGIITSPAGEVILTAGTSATLLDTGTPNVTVNFSATDNQALNVGQIVMQGGSANIYGAMVRNEGIVSASSAVSEGGRIVLKATKSASLSKGTNSTGQLAADGATGGGDIRVEGASVMAGSPIHADGAQGGHVSILATGEISLAEPVSAKGTAGKGGNIDYTAGSITETSTGRTDVSGTTDGGWITAKVDGSLMTSGRYLAIGANGAGGQVDFTAYDLRLLSADIDASGYMQGGLVRMGGGYQGGRTDESDPTRKALFLDRWTTSLALTNASRTFVNDAAHVNVSSKVGAGGTAVFWSDTQTTFLGQVNAAGATQGGAVEISSKELLRRADLSGITGAAEVLLDPKNITIGDAATVSSWNYQGIIGKGYNASYLETDDTFGVSVSLNAAGDRLAVGAHGDDGSNNATNKSGAAYLFSFSDTSFSGGSLQAILGKGYSGGKNIDIANLESTDSFGSSVSLNAAGDRLAVGAHGDSGTGNSANDSGAAYLFTFTDTTFSSGSLQATLGKGYSGGKNINMAGLQAFDYFGKSVALNATGDRLVVGASGDDGNGNAATDSGAAYLFSFSDTGFSGGSLLGTIGKGYAGGKSLNVASLEAGDSLGYSAALNAAGDRLALGALREDGSGNVASQSGAVHLFSFTDTSFSGGSLQATLGKGYSGGKNIDVASLEVDDFFGAGVALNAAGDRLAVGALGDDGSGNIASLSGAAYLFNFSDTNFSGGSLQAILGKAYGGGNNLNVSGLEVDDSFGISVALNAAGDRLAVGASGDDDIGNTASSSGAVYLFAAATTYSAAGQTFSSLPDASITVSRSNLESLLGAGTAVTLQASNDITVASAVTANNPSGNGGALTLQAGRSVLINSNISTDNGALDITSNVALAAGVVDAQRDAGAASVTMAGGTSLNTGSGTLNITIGTGAGLTNNTGGNMVLQDILGGSVFLRNDVGNITVSGTVVATSLELNGSSATATLANAGNNITTLTSNLASLALANANASATVNLNAGNLNLPNNTITGSLNLASGTTLNNAANVVNNGVVKGIGTIDLNGNTLTNNGTLSPGIGAGGTGTLSITGNLALGSAGTVAIDVGGTGSGQYDKLAASGNVTLDGTLIVAEVSGYAPAANDYLPFLTTGGVSSGSFATATLPTDLALDYSASGIAPRLVSQVASQPVQETDAAVAAVATSTQNDILSTVGTTTIDIALTGGALTVGGTGSTTDTTQMTSGGIDTGLAAGSSSPASSTTSDSGAASASATGSGTTTTDTASSSSTSSSATDTPATTATTSSTDSTTASGSTSSSDSTAASGSASSDTTPASSGESSSNATTSSADTTSTSNDSASPGTSSTSEGTSATSESGTSSDSEAVTGSPKKSDSETRKQPESTPSAKEKSGDRKESDESKRDDAKSSVRIQAMTNDIERRQELKTAVLTEAVEQLRKDPTAADLKVCPGDGELCIATSKSIKRPKFEVPASARLPQIERKVAIVLGVEDYEGAIPSLKTPVRDMEAVGKSLSSKYGYEVRSKKNPTKADIVREINRVIEESAETDSVVIYYAGHGYVMKETDTGYWIPANGSAKDPKNWLSNRDITRMLNNIPAKQVMLVSDSCFSGKLTEGSNNAALAKPSSPPTDILKHRSVVVLSSGGDEPVADQGRDGHSVFANNFLDTLSSSADVAAGSRFSETVREGVTKDFVQVPKYSPVSAAGHESGGDFLFERRERANGAR